MGRLAYEGQAPHPDADTPTIGKWEEPVLQPGSSPDDAGGLAGGNTKAMNDTAGFKQDQGLESPGSESFTGKTGTAFEKEAVK